MTIGELAKILPEVKEAYQHGMTQALLGEALTALRMIRDRATKGKSRDMISIHTQAQMTLSSIEQVTKRMDAEETRR